MAERKPTVAQVIASANTARQSLSLTERQLQEDIDAIDFRAFKEKRPLTAAESDKRKELRASQAEVREAFRVLGFVTAQRLDNTVEVERIRQQMQIINDGLQDDLARLKRLERYSRIAAQVADALAKAVERLAAIAASGALPV
jgi:hypothetical protein